MTQEPQNTESGTKGKWPHNKSFPVLPDFLSEDERTTIRIRVRMYYGIRIPNYRSPKREQNTDRTN